MKYTLGLFRRHHVICFYFLEFYFVAVISLWNSRFTLDYANPESEAYLTLKQDIITEVL